MTPDLDSAFRRLAAAFARCPVRSGTLTYRAPVALTAPLDLGPVLAEYYSKLVFDDEPTLGGMFRQAFFGPGEIEGAQHGWHFITDRQGRPVEDPAWPATWVVIADRDGDAIFVDTVTETGATFMSIQKRNRRVAPSLANYLTCLAACVEMENERFPDGAKDADFNPLPEFIVEVQRVTAEHLSPDDRAGFMHFYFG